MRYSVLNSLIGILVVLLFSCSPRIIKDFHKSGTTHETRDALFPFFHPNDSVHYFNMQIDFRKNHFSGMLIVKQTMPGTYRMVLNSYFGMGIFDMEISRADFKMNHCMDALNKKRVINTLKEDFQTIFLYNVPDSFSAQVYTSRTDSAARVYKLETASGNGYYLVDNEQKQLRALEIPRFIAGLRFEFDDYSRGFPDSIRIDHSHIGLRFRLDKIPKD